MGFFSNLKKAFNPGGDDTRILQVGTSGTAVILSLREARMTVKTGGTLPKNIVKHRLAGDATGTGALYNYHIESCFNDRYSATYHRKGTSYKG